MLDFAKQLGRLIDAQPEGAIGVARRAFPTASAKEHIQKAAYLSKLRSETNKENPSLATFNWIAKGMGCLSLHDFFRRLERIGLEEAEIDLHESEKQSKNVQSNREGVHGPSLPSTSGGFDSPTLILAAVEEITASLDTAAERVVAALEGLATRVGQAPSSHARTSSRGTRHSTKPRKAS